MPNLFVCYALCLTVSSSSSSITAFLAASMMICLSIDAPLFLLVLLLLHCYISSCNYDDVLVYRCSFCFFITRYVLLHLLLLICKQGKPAEIRQAAGLLLKNNLRTAYNSLAPLNQQYVKSELLPCLGAADRGIRLTVGTVISVIVQQGHIFSWPELLQGLVQCLDSNDLNHMEGAMDALSKVGTALSESLACSLSLFHVTFWNDVDFFFRLSMNCLFKIGDASLIGFTLHGNFFI